MRGFARRPAAVAVAAVLAVSVVPALSACGGGGTAVQVGAQPGSGPAGPSGTGSNGSTSSIGSTGSTGSARVDASASALGGLQGFLTEVDRLDARLRGVAELVNADITATGVHARPATLAAIRSLSTEPVARAFPGGMSPALTRAAIGVFSNLSSRTGAFVGVPDGFRAAKSSEYRQMTDCLANGSRAVARYGADVSALRRLAQESPAFTAAAPPSRAAAEAALQTAYVEGGNRCCETCGGHLGDEIAPVVWRTTEARAAANDDGVDGTVDGIEFESWYRAGAGWTIRIHAG